MRISTANAFETSVTQLQQRQRALSAAQERLTGGKRVLDVSDDPAAAAAAERALALQSRSESALRGLGASRDAMQLTESTLGTAGELMQQAREQLVAAGNGTLSDAERGTLAASIQGLRDDLFALANRSDGAGRYLFGGQGSDSAPFVDGSPVTYAATRGQLMATSHEPSPLSVDGQSVWLDAPDPTSAGATMSVFTTLDQMVADLQTPGRTGTAIAGGVAAGLRGLDIAMDNVGAWRAHAGEALNRIDGIESRLQQTKLDAQRTRSDAEDLDMLAAISDFQAKQSGYDAALKTYSIVQRLSLFDQVR